MQLNPVIHYRMVRFVDEGTAMVETLEAVKEEFEHYETHPDYHVGIASAMKNAGVGVGCSGYRTLSNIKIIDGKGSH